MFRFVVIPHHMNMKRYNNIVCGMRRMEYENHNEKTKTVLRKMQNETFLYEINDE